jgi:rhamnose utilization protein RhaD (predicted bifunctional aldolase and dehydrogenase)
MSVADLVEISRYYGADTNYVIAGGGNTSFKDGATLYIKGSGTSLAEATAEGFVRMDREALARIWEKTYPADPEARESAVLVDMMAAKMPGEEQKRPSVETLLHDMLPFVYVVHTHPALVNGLTCSQGAEKTAATIFGGEALWINSTNPGYILSRTVKEAMSAYSARTGRPASVILLQNHGIFVGADTTAEIIAIYSRIIDTLTGHIKRQPDFSGASLGSSREIAETLEKLSGKAAVFQWNNEIARLVKDRTAFYPVSSAFTPDHIVYAGSDPLFVETGPETPEAVAAVQAAWKQHLDKTGRQAKIVAVQGLGVFALGSSEKTAALALELFTDAAKVAAYSEAFGGPRFMTPEQIDFINNWEIERYRSRVVESGNKQS